jgi:TMEM175 potassium channel family protein
VADGPESVLSQAVGRDWKGKLSPVLYVVAIATTFWSKWLAQALYVFVALIWLIPDRRIEHALRQRSER